MASQIESGEASSFEGYTKTRARFESAGQGHVFRFWESLEASEKTCLLEQLKTIDLSICSELETAMNRHDGLRPGAEIGDLPTIPLPESTGERKRWADARRRGEEALRRGRIGAFLAAGGQGSRLGFEGPKGTFPIGPVTDRSLFQLFAEGILAHGLKWGVPIPLLVMTSPENHESTVRFFAERGNFGLAGENLHFIPQGMLPAFTSQGKILLSSKSRVFLNPDGHGGALRLLSENGGVGWFEDRGVDTLYYFQVDNPLLPVPDPVFIGHHLASGSLFTTKVARKTGPEERMGVFARVDGAVRVVEYMHLSEEMARESDGRGRLVFWAGNVAVHVLDLPFVADMRGASPLPLHVTRKPESGIDEEGRPLDPDKPSALKLETFIFDAIPLAKTASVVEVEREEEFGPVKSSQGRDTPDRARRMMTAKAARWLEAAGAEVPRDATGQPLHPIEISPLTALGPEDLVPIVRKGLDLSGPTAL